MTGLDLAAGVIAVVDLSAKVASLCFQYSREVQRARNDILRLQGQVESLKDTFGRVRQLLDGPDGAKLSASQDIPEAIRSCSARLESLKNKLEPRKPQKAMSR